MTGIEALEYLSKNDFVSVAVGMGTNKQKHLEAYKVIKKDLEKLKEIGEIILVTRMSLQTILDTKIALQTDIIDPNITKAQAYDKIREVFKNA